MQGRNLATCLALVVLVWATQAEAYKGGQLAPKAKITIAEARSIALKAHPGTITDEELENEEAAVVSAIPSISRAADTSPKSASMHRRARSSKTRRRGLILLAAL